jgi:hypothetical protein
MSRRKTLTTTPPIILVSMLITLPVPTMLDRRRALRISEVSRRLRKIAVPHLAGLDTVIGELEALATCIESRKLVHHGDAENAE